MCSGLVTAQLVTVRLVLIRLALVIVATLAIAPGPAAAQDIQQQRANTEPAAAEAPDLEAWERLATRAEQTLTERQVPSDTLLELRAELVEKRSRFLTVQDANRERVLALRRQIEALGPPPEQGETEAPEIAERRAALTEQLTRAQAPVLTADEAFRRADGLIRTIDRVLRERDADALMTLWPSPVNPANWLAGVDALMSSGLTVYGEVLGNVRDPAVGVEFRSNLPVVIGALLMALLLIARGRSLTERVTLRLQENASSKRGRQAMALVASLAQIAVPLLGVFLLVVAVEATALTGPTGSDTAGAFFVAGFYYLAARWLGGQIFTRADYAYTPLTLPHERRREGRFMASLAGLFLGLYAIMTAFVEPAVQTDAANAVIAFPLLVLAGVVLFRIGQLLLMHTRQSTQRQAESAESGAEAGSAGFFDRLVGVLGRACMVLGIGAPVLAGVGYVQAAEALLFPAIESLGLLGVLVLLQRMVGDIYAALVKSDSDATEALIPALIGFALAVVSVPVFALIWGVRVSELLEIWQAVREGFTIGETRISPTNLLSFIVVFAIGYTVTRVIQGALGSSVLPKTSLDRGGQKAIVSGTGYVGIFLAAVIAFSTAGIDLSALALVAGALSVGIGFGLQNVVSNFISGIILLVERPIAEGDWIEVGGTMGVVRSISVRSTVIETFDRTDVIVPNADLISTSVTNWTHYNNTGRLIVKVGVSYAADTREVERILREVAEAQPLVALNPPPSVVFMGFGANALEFEVRCILRDVNFIMKVRSDMNHEIIRRFRAAGIEIPFAQRDIWLRNPESLPGARPVPATEPDAGADDSPARRRRPPQPGDPVPETARPDCEDMGDPDGGNR
ncbi:MAG: mechanosensitive ion channel family protein [Rhodobacteraceae bacterium]|nr:mechanosensitive ion channel family protein [Paracoccaceae bacterium]